MSDDEWIDISPDEQLEGWTGLPYTFTVEPSVFDDLRARGVDEVRLRELHTDTSQWNVDGANRKLVCRGDGPHMWLRYGSLLRDFEAHVEWRLLVVPDTYVIQYADVVSTLYNSGVMIRTDPVSNRFYQAEIGAHGQRAGFIFTKKFLSGVKTTIYGRMLLDGKPVDFTPDRAGARDLIRPPGQWNTYDIRVKGSEIRLRTNGEWNSVFPDCEIAEGYFGLEAEGFPIEFRNLHLRVIR